MGGFQSFIKDFVISSRETDINVISMEVFRNFFWVGHNVPLGKIKVCVRYIKLDQISWEFTEVLVGTN